MKSMQVLIILFVEKVNAAYFKGLWASQFKAANTRLSQFFFNNNKDAGVTNMMFQKGRFRTALSEELQAQILEMPFLGDDVSFFAILPQGTNSSLEETVNRLSLDNLREAMTRTFPGNSIEVGLPKFKLEQTLSLRNVSGRLKNDPKLIFFSNEKLIVAGSSQAGLDRLV